MKKFIRNIFFGKPTQSVVNSISLHGYRDNTLPIKFIDYLSDQELEEVNALLNWNAFVADSQGRRFGNIAWAGKRMNAQAVPDPRHVILNARLDLSEKKVLEIGCFEGIHTVSLCGLAKEVVAIDSRMENILKTIVRCNFFNEKPTVFKCDVETWNVPDQWLQADICHHIGVLYHLADPIRHLNKLSTLISEGIFLDTHIATSSDNLEEYTVEGKNYRYKRYSEGKDVFSGMNDHSKWLLFDDLKKALRDCGFTNIDVIEERAERNGSRVLLLATR